jgi:50S ribosomal subunit-associated GTPase HflX
MVGAPLKELPAHTVQEHMEELHRLLDTAGGDMVGTLIQRIDAPNAHTFIGRERSRSSVISCPSARPTWSSSTKT